MQKCAQHRSRHLGAIVIFLLGALAFGPASAVDERPPDNAIVIGQSTDLSGIYSQVSRQFILGANVYFTQLNARGGIQGRPVRLLTMDDKNNPELALKNTEELVNEQKALTLFGYVSAKTAAAVLPFITEQRIPYFAPVSGAKLLYAPFNRHIFTIRASYVDEYRHLLPRFAQIGLKRVAIFNDTAGLPHRALMQGLISEANIQLVSFESGLGMDVGKTADNLLQSKPDVVMLMSISHDISSSLIKSLRSKGYLGYFYCASLVCSPLLTDELENAATGMLITQIVPFPWKATLPIVGEYQKAMTKAGVKKFNYLSLEGYIAAKVLSDGLVRAGPHATREKLITALENLNGKSYKNDGYPINFSSTNHQGSTYVDLTTVGKAGVIVN